MDRCKNCCHWNKFEDKLGRCQRRAPQGIPFGLISAAVMYLGYADDELAATKLSRTYWPITRSEEHCGEFSFGTYTTGEAHGGN